MSRFGTPGDPFKKLEDQRFKEEMDQFRKPIVAGPGESREERETHAALRAEEDALCPHMNADANPTTPALLSAARLDEIRERHTRLATAIAIDRDLTPDEEVEAEQDMGALLAHLDALTPPAVPDGEAERARLADDHERVCRLARTTERARDEAQELAEDRAGQIARLQAEVAGAAHLAAVLSAHWPDDLPAVEERSPVTVADVAGRVLLRMQEEQERLTAELAGAHDRAIVFGRNVVASTERAMQAKIDALEAELAEARRHRDEARAMVCVQKADLRKATAAADAARREGAREACAALLAVVDRITFDAPDDKPNGPAEQAIDDMSKALEVERWPFNVRSRVADLNGYMATLCNALADDCHDLKAAADIVRTRGEDRPPCPGEGWEWDAFALQWHQPGAKGKAIATSRARGEGQGS